MGGEHRTYQLDNGLVVALERTDTQTISGELRIFHGALNEGEGEEGMAHFLEHNIIFGGTQSYTPRQVLGIGNRLGRSNAHTKLDETVLTVGMLPDDLELYLAFSSDAVFFPRLDEEVIEQERMRVLREIADSRQGSSYADTRLFLESFFWEKEPRMQEKSLGMKPLLLKRPKMVSEDFIRQVMVQAICNLFL